MKFLFAPIGIGAGLVAGFAAQKVFDRVWSAIDDEEPPEPDTREVSIPKMIGALALEGAIFRLAKGFAEHGARSGFAALTGRWPGEERPEPN
jgi:Protein of unknown function (DUF4235)